MSGTTREALVANAARILCDNDAYVSPGSEEEQGHYQKASAIFSTYRDNTLNLICEKGKDGAYELFTAVVYGDIAESDVIDWCMIADVLTSFKAPLDNSANHRDTDLSSYIAAFPFYKNLVPQQDGYYPSERLAQVTSIIRVTQHLDAKGIKTKTEHPENDKLLMFYIRDEKLRDLLTTHPDPQRVADTIIERTITDADQVREMVEVSEGTAAALRAGAI